jgi:hypothetical protein
VFFWGLLVVPRNPVEEGGPLGVHSVSLGELFGEIPCVVRGVNY